MELQPGVWGIELRGFGSNTMLLSDLLHKRTLPQLHKGIRREYRSLPRLLKEIWREYRSLPRLLKEIWRELRSLPLLLKEI